MEARIRTALLNILFYRNDLADKIDLFQIPCNFFPLSLDSLSGMNSKFSCAYFVKFLKNKNLSIEKPSEPVTGVMKAIYEDDLEGLIEISSQTKLKWNTKVLEDVFTCSRAQVPILHLSIIKHSIKCFKFLLLNGANPLDEIRPMGIDARGLCGAFGDLEMLTIIHERGIPFNTQFVYYCGLTFRNKYIEKMSENEYSDSQFEPLFLKTIESNNIDGFIQVLALSNGKIKQSYLSHAAENGSFEIVKILLQLGCNPNISEKNSTPIHHAIHGKSIETIKLLLKLAGRNVNTRDAGKNTPLHLAAKANYVEICQLLLKAGAYINFRNERQETPIHCAVEEYANEACIILLKSISGNETEDQGWTPLHYAVHLGLGEIARNLLQKGADPNCKDKNGVTPLLMAKKNAEMLGILKKFKLNK